MFTAKTPSRQERIFLENEQTAKTVWQKQKTCFKGFRFFNTFPLRLGAFAVTAFSVFGGEK
ncbi:MAG TPA: hypothetical protein VJ873_05965 [bacterium]|nr:hypothetical protein [bacterium]